MLPFSKCCRKNRRWSPSPSPHPPMAELLGVSWTTNWTVSLPWHSIPATWRICAVQCTVLLLQDSYLMIYIILYIHIYIFCSFYMFLYSFKCGFMMFYVIWFKTVHLYLCADFVSGLLSPSLRIELHVSQRGHMLKPHPLFLGKCSEDDASVAVVQCLKWQSKTGKQHRWYFLVSQTKVYTL